MWWLPAAIALAVVELAGALIVVAMLCVFFFDERAEKREAAAQRSQADELEALYRLGARIPPHEHDLET